MVLTTTEEEMFFTGSEQQNHGKNKAVTKKRSGSPKVQETGPGSVITFGNLLSIRYHLCRKRGARNPEDFRWKINESRFTPEQETTSPLTEQSIHLEKRERISCENGTTPSRGQAFNLPVTVRAGIKKTVMKTVAAALPELNGRGFHPIASPKGWQGDFSV